MVDGDVFFLIVSGAAHGMLKLQCMKVCGTVGKAGGLASLPMSLESCLAARLD